MKIANKIIVGVQILLSAFLVQNVSAEEKFVVTSEVPLKTNPSPYIVQFIEMVEKLSDGELKGEYFEAGQLYTDSQALAALGTGTVHFVFPVSTRLEQLDKRTGILNLPFKINYNQMQNECFYQGLTAMTSEYLSDTGIKILGFMRTAELIFLMGDDDINKVTDFEGKRIRLVGGKVMQEAMRSVGASPVSMAASEMAMAFSQGAIDGAMTSPAGWAHVLGTAAKYGIMFPGMSLATSAVAVDGAWYNSLKPKHKETIDNALGTIIEKQWVETIEKDKDLIEEMEAKGGIYHNVSDTQVNEMEKRFSKASSSFSERYPEVMGDYQEILSRCL